MRDGDGRRGPGRRGWRRLNGRPVAVISIGPDGVKVETIVDVSKLGIAAISAWGALAVFLARFARLRGGFEIDLEHDGVFDAQDAGHTRLSMPNWSSVMLVVPLPVTSSGETWL